jgi:hypothetical protein
MMALVYPVIATVFVSMIPFWLPVAAFMEPALPAALIRKGSFEKVAGLLNCRVAVPAEESMKDVTVSEIL